MTLSGQASPELSIRAQLIVPEQRTLFDYWRSKFSGESMPARSDINPAEIKELLPSLSILEMQEGGPLHLRVRLAGTRLRDGLDMETTGRHLDEFDWGDQREYWEMAYREVLGNLRPAQGVVPMTPWRKPHIFQFWLRLPLADSEGRISMVLGHDAFMQSEKAHAIAGRANLRIA